MNKLIIKKFVLIFCSIFFTLLITGCPTYEGKQIIIKNSTSDVVTIIKVHYSQDIQIKTNESVSIFVDYNGEGFDLEIVRNGETYTGNTGYVQDYNKISIEILDDMQIKVTVKNAYGKDEIMEKKLSKIE